MAARFVWGADMGCEPMHFGAFTCTCTPIFFAHYRGALRQVTESERKTAYDNFYGKLTRDMLEAKVHAHSESVTVSDWVHFLRSCYYCVICRYPNA